MIFALIFILIGVSQAAPKNIKVSAVVSETGKIAGGALQSMIGYELFVEKIYAEAETS